jgi:RimJ/RimL family protein N-acetyltransferase
MGEDGTMQIFLETDRLILRRFTEADADLLVELDGDPEVMKYINGGRPTPREEIQNEYLPWFLHYYDQESGYGFWAAVEKSTGEFLGWFHLRPPREDGSPTNRSSGTGCAGRPGARATPPRDRWP